MSVLGLSESSPTEIGHTDGSPWEPDVESGDNPWERTRASGL